MLRALPPTSGNPILLVVGSDRRATLSIAVAFESHGFRVLAAENFSLAASLIPSLTRALDLAVLDIGPGDAIADLLAALDRHAPRTGVLLLVPHGGAIPPGRNVLVKPIDPAHLLEAATAAFTGNPLKP